MEEAVQTLMATTGAQRDHVIRCLEMAGGDPNVAFELCLADPVQLAQMQAAHNMGAGEEEEGSYDDEGGLGGLAAFVNNPQFQMLRQRMLQNPAFFQEFMATLQQQQPELYAEIQQNPMAFMNLIMSGGQGGAMPTGGASVGQPHAGQMPPNMPPQGGIQVTPKEMEAIQRLQSLGFSQGQAA